MHTCEVAHSKVQRVATLTSEIHTFGGIVFIEDLIQFRHKLLVRALRHHNLLVCMERVFGKGKLHEMENQDGKQRKAQPH